ncbi:MAG: pyridoxal phosphate-dependent aminotransferase, partial [bacterium]
VSLSAGEPDFDTPAHIKAAADEAIRRGFTKYTPASGIVELKAGIAALTKTRQGLSYEVKQGGVTCGAKHAIANALVALVNEGDEVLILAPFWVSYPAMAQLAGGTPRILYADGLHRPWDPDAAHLTPPDAGFKITPAALRGALNARTKVLILNAPSNPAGSIYTAAELQALAAVLRDFPRVWVISDEIYDALTYAGPARSLPAVALVVNGASKAYAMTGWRIGWALGPEAVITAMGNLQSQTTSNPSSIAQHAALAAVTGDQACVETMRVEFAKRRDFITGLLNAIPGVRCAAPDGAFYVFPDLRGVQASAAARAALKLGPEPQGFSAALAARLLDDAKVALVPGAEFGLECHVRLSFAASTETIAKAVGRIRDTVAALTRG